MFYFITDVITLKRSTLCLCGIEGIKSHNILTLFPLLKLGLHGPTRYQCL